MKLRSLVCAVSVFASLMAALAGTRGYDRSLEEFPRQAGETDDTARIQRAIDATGGGVLYLPRGDYSIASTLTISNCCALSMHKNAKLIAKSQMEYVVVVRNNAWNTLDFNDFIEGGVIDGNGMASCLLVQNYWGYKLTNLKLFNPKKYGLHVGKGGAELVANGLYVLTRLHGLAGNTGLFLEGGDSHFNDIFILDCTVGVRTMGASNRLTRVHVWGGSLPRRNKDEIPEMLVDSVCFLIEGHSTILRDCYADTGKIGFAVRGAWEVRLLGCSYFNNKAFGLDDITIIRQVGETGALLVDDCVFTRANEKEKIKVYSGNGGVRWGDIIYAGNWAGVERPGTPKDGEGKMLESPNTKLAGY